MKQGACLLLMLFLLVELAGPVASHGKGRCRTNADCNQADYCQKPKFRCRARGQCEPRPARCTLLLDPVCGCDGTVYGNRCRAAGAGVSLARSRRCRVPRAADQVHAACASGGGR